MISSLVMLVALYAGASTASSTTASSTSTPAPAYTSCGIVNAIPTPTGSLICAGTGFVNAAPVITAFATSANGYYDKPCATECFANSRCGGFAFNSTAQTCQLYATTVGQDDFVQDYAAQTLWDKRCYSSRCARCFASPTASPSKTKTKECKQAKATQLVQNPGFDEGSSGKPWQVLTPRTVKVVAHDDPNAFDGLGYALFNVTQGQSGTISQKLDKTVRPNTAYDLQYRAARIGDDSYDTCTWTISLGKRIVQQIPFNALSDAGGCYGDYGGVEGCYGAVFVGDITPSESRSALAFTLTCPKNEYPTIGTVFLDKVDLSPAATTCNFRIQLNSNQQPLYNGNYLYLENEVYDEPYSTPKDITVLAATTDPRTANIFSLDAFGFLHTGNRSLSTRYAATDYGVDFVINFDDDAHFSQSQLQQVFYLDSATNALTPQQPQEVNTYVLQYCNPCQLDPQRLVYPGLQITYSQDAYKNGCATVNLTVVPV